MVPTKLCVHSWCGSCLQEASLSVFPELVGMTGLCSGQQEHLLLFRSETSALPHFHLPAVGQVMTSVNDYEINRKHAHYAICKWLHLISNNWIVLAPGQSIPGQRRQDNDFSVDDHPVCASSHWGAVALRLRSSRGWCWGWQGQQPSYGAKSCPELLVPGFHSQAPLLPLRNDHLQEQ